MEINTKEELMNVIKDLTTKVEGYEERFNALETPATDETEEAEGNNDETTGNEKETTEKTEEEVDEIDKMLSSD